ncbi:MAG: hypothetical protein A4E65_01462 [Syntrophorhabdus sp. PtaU1.Bin153]|nr:MAG: hypothetical protein A4E65_01462 [Syntrophorhabdus sp. PtaU1.Bin153]
MCVRMTFFKAKPGRMDHLRNICVNDVIPPRKGHKGIRFVHVFERMDAVDEGISVTARDTRGIWRLTKGAGTIREFWHFSVRYLEVRQHSSRMR